MSESVLAPEGAGPGSGVPEGDVSTDGSVAPEDLASAALRRDCGGEIAAGGWRPWRVGLGLFLAALAATFASSTAFVGDNRVEQFVNPGRRLVRMLHMWDPTRGLGRVREDFWPGETIPLAVLRAFGLSPAATQHVWHALLITAGAVGVVFLLRVWWPRVGWLHLLAATIWGFGPYSATFLLPSNLYYHYVLVPWLAWCMVRGTTAARGTERTQKWRYEAGFALLIASAGNADLPGLLFAGLALVPLAGYLIWVERRATWSSFVGWIGRAGVLTVACSLVWLYKTLASAGTYANRLNTTELARNVSFASSFAESWRGLGFWLSYFQDRRGFTRPQGAQLFENPAVVAATFSVPVLAVWGARPALLRTRARRSVEPEGDLRSSRARPRPEVWFVASMLLALVVLVAAFPRGNPSPYGHTLLASFRVIPGLSAMRNSYKVGSALMLGIAPLAALGVVRICSAARRRPTIWRRGAAVLAVMGVVGAAAPFWTGSLYDKSKVARSTPDYWDAALKWLDSQPATGRVFVAPGATRADYRWGFFGDDFLDARLRRPHVVDLSVPLSTPIATSTIRAADVAAVSRYAQPNEGLVTTLRRMGVRYVLVRNDLRWERIGVGRPALYRALRESPELRLVQSFGTPGQNTSAPRITGVVTAPQVAAYERQLPPVEIYEIADPHSSSVWGWAPQAPLLVAGDGSAMVSLAQAGVLSANVATEYTASLTDAQLARRLGDGAEVVITDTNRRRVVVNDGWRADVGETMSVRASAGRVVSDAFLTERPGTETVATYGDAASVASTGPPRPASGFQNWNRPSQAFDGDPLTQWLTAGFDNPIGRALLVEFDTPKVLGFAAVSVANRTLGGRVVSRATLELSDGSLFPLDLTNGYAEAGFPSRAVTWAAVRIDAVSGPGNASVGFNEVALGDLAISERIALPSDVFSAAARRPAIANALNQTRVSYVMAGLDGSGIDREERALRRSFQSTGDRVARLSGTVRIEPATGDQVIDSLLELPHFAGATARDRGDLAGAGIYAVDGDLSTGWAAPPTAGHVLSVRVPTQVVRSIEVLVDAGARATRIDGMFVDVAGKRLAADVAYPEECASTGPCFGTARFDLPAAVSAESFSVTVGSFGEEATSAAGDTLSARVLEVRTNDEANKPFVWELPVPQGCRGVVVALDGEWVPVRVSATMGQVVRGEPLAIESCSDFSLAAGGHTIDGAGGPTVEALKLITAPAGSSLNDSTPAPASPSEVSVLAAGPSVLRVNVRGSGGLVTNGQSWDPRWKATVDGRPLGSPRMIDGLSAWNIPPGAHEVVMSLGAESPFRATVFLSALAVLCCGWLVARRGATGD